MAILPRPAAPSVLLADLRAFVREGDRRYKLLFGALAIGMTSLWVTMFIVESWWGVKPEGEQIVYAASWSNTRSDAQIIAQQKIDQRAKDQALAEKRRAFQRVDAAMTKLGI